MEHEYDSNEEYESDTESEISNDGDSDTEENKLKYSFARACWKNDVEKIQELAPHFDLKTIRFKNYYNKPDPIELCLNDDGDTKGIETLLELGAEVTPNYAYRITALIPFDAPESYIEYFKKKGYDLYKLSYQAENPYYMSRGEISQNLEYNRQFDFKNACIKRDLDTIRELAAFFDLNDIRIGGKYYKEGLFRYLSPLLWSLSPTGEIDAAELLLSLGARPTPYDAYYILHLIDIRELSTSYLDFFHDLEKLAKEYVEAEGD